MNNKQLHSIVRKSILNEIAHSKIQDSEVLQYQLNKYNWNMSDIARLYNVSPSTVMRWCRKLNISKPQPINESQGVSEDNIAFARKIAYEVGRFIQNLLLKSPDLICDMIDYDFQEQYFPVYENGGGNRGVQIRIFYESNFYEGGKKADADENEIGINYAWLEYILFGISMTEYAQLKDEYYELDDDELYDADESDFKDGYDTAEYLKDINAKFGDVLERLPDAFGQILSGNGTVTSVILHELTHISDESDDDAVELAFMSRLPYDMGLAQDVKDIAYLFNDREMRARIASAAEVFKGLIPEGEYDDDHLNDAFRDMLNQIYTDRELRVHDMEFWVKSMRESGIDQRSMRLLIGDNAYGIKSVAFWVSINDKNLYYSKNIKQLKRDYLYHQQEFCNKVADHYQKILDDYKYKIARVCWFIYSNSERFNYFEDLM